MLTEKYLNLFTDFGFKKLFGEEQNKEHLIAFLNAFEQAQIAKLEPEDRNAYEDSLKYYRDLKNVIDTAKEESFEEGKAVGLAEGEMKGKIEVAQKMLAQGIDSALIANVTGLSVEDIVRLG